MTTGLHVKTIFMLLAALTLSATSMPLAQAEIISKNPDPVAAPDSVAASPDSVPPEIIIDIKAAVDSISSGYDSEWLALSMQGKLSFTGLPIRPNVKIYMKRGESIIMSARAPIFGEVARVEISPTPSPASTSTAALTAPILSEGWLPALLPTRRTYCSARWLSPATGA